MKDFGLKMVGKNKLIHGFRPHTNVVTLGFPHGCDEVMALAIISVARSSDIWLYAAADRAKVEEACVRGSYVWTLGLAADGYDPDSLMYNHLRRRPGLEAPDGLAGLLWKDYGELICTRYCLLEEEKKGMQHLIAEEVRNSLIQDIDKAAAQRNLESTVYSMLSSGFYALRDGTATNRDKCLTEAFKNARVLLLHSIEVASQKVRSASLVIDVGGCAEISA